MKKKMTILAILVAAVVITGYSVAGTYAKYTTENSDFTAEARVAKWKIGLANEVKLFGDSYILDAGGADTGANQKGKVNDAAWSSATSGTIVKSSAAQDYVVAPGTKGEYKFKISGDVETNYTLAITLEAESEEITDGNGYSPIHYTINGTGDYTTLSDLVNALNAKFSGKTFAAGDAESNDITIGWYWEFESAETKNNEDTTLGKKAAGEGAESIKTDVSFTVKVTATQSQSTDVTALSTIFASA